MRRIDWTTIFLGALTGLVLQEIWKEIKKREVVVREPASLK